MRFLIFLHQCIIQTNNNYSKKCNNIPFNLINNTKSQDEIANIEFNSDIYISFSIPKLEPDHNMKIEIGSKLVR